ncbi:MAG TPA: dodecin family protein [Burkholderiales bacterium]|nr:dodecin family protein [Burkholderiales bacterium]
MAKKNQSDGIYKIVEIVGSSKISWEDAAKHAVQIASRTLRDLRVAEITKLDMKVEEGKVVAYRARVTLSFKYQA